MTTPEEQKIERVWVEVDLANYEDLVLANAGVIPQDKVRRTRIRGVVDSRAARLVIPEAVALQLGLQTPTIGRIQHARPHSALTFVTTAVHLAYVGRDSVFNAFVDPDRDTALIGRVILGELDLLVDFTAHRLVPRDPEQIVCEM